MGTKRNGKGLPCPAINVIQNHIFDQLIAHNLMDSKLIIKNFGPIKNVDLDLKNVNVFIGQQASGKSAIAKLFTIFKAPRFFFLKTYKENKLLNSQTSEDVTNTFLDILKEYNIHSFLGADTEIEYISELHKIAYKNEVIEYTPSFFIKIEYLKELATSFQENREMLIVHLTAIARKYVRFRIEAERMFKKEIEESEIDYAYFNKINELNLPSIIKIIEKLEEDLSTHPVVYIPAERNFSNIIKKSALNLMVHNVPIPKHLLTFGAYLEKIDVAEIDLGFIQIGLKYKNVNGEDRIALGDSKEILLIESASGIQSVLPIIETVLHSGHPLNHNSFVIEEPELNLFPLAQYGLIQLLESRRSQYHRWEDTGTIHTYTTHSPYILSCLNNLLYADKVKNKIANDLRDSGVTDYFEALDKAKNVVGEIVNGTIPPNYFSAYQIADGMASSIFNRTTGLIDDNYIDDASEKIDSDFEQLMVLNK